MRHSPRLRQLVLLMCTLCLFGAQTLARGEVIGTARVLDALERQATIEQIDTVLAQAEVRNELERLGVDPAETSARVAALSDAELVELAENLEGLPAGGSLIGTVGLVFIVLLILELVGVIDIFNKI